VGLWITPTALGGGSYLVHVHLPLLDPLLPLDFPLPCWVVLVFLWFSSVCTTHTLYPSHPLVGFGFGSFEVLDYYTPTYACINVVMCIPMDSHCWTHPQVGPQCPHHTATHVLHLHLWVSYTSPCNTRPCLVLFLAHVRWVGFPSYLAGFPTCPSCPTVGLTHPIW